MSMSVHCGRKGGTVGSLLKKVTSFELTAFLDILVVPMMDFFHPVFKMNSSVALVFRTFMYTEVNVSCYGDSESGVVTNIVTTILTARKAT